LKLEKILRMPKRDHKKADCGFKTKGSKRPFDRVGGPRGGKVGRIGREVKLGPGVVTSVQKKKEFGEFCPEKPQRRPQIMVDSS